MRTYPELVKYSQMINHINSEYTSNVLGAFYVHNERIVMETGKTLNAGILFETKQLGA